MPSNLVYTVLNMLTPDVIARIAAALGIDSAKAQSAVAAAVPALLAAFGGVAAQPGGAQKLADAAQRQGDSLGGGNQASLADNGSSILSSLLGAGGGSSLASVIGKFSGMDQGASSSLLGTLAPLVMGGLAKQSGGDLSAQGIAGLLASEKDNIAAAMPSGLGDMLRGAGLAGSLSSSAGAAAAAATQTVRSGTAASVSAVSGASQRAAAAAPASRGWLYWLLPLLVIAAVVYYLFGRSADHVAQQPTTPTPAQTQTETPAQAPAEAPANVDLSKQAADSISSVQTTLAGITDAATAQAAMPKLQGVSDQIDKLTGAVGQLSAEQRAALVGIVKPALPTLNALFDKVLAIPGVSDVLKPTIDALKAKFAALAP